MSGRQIALVMHAALLIGALFFIVPRLTAWDGRAGYLLVVGFYWLAFCLPVIVLHALPGNDGRLFSEKLPWRDWWILPLLLGQASLVAAIYFVPHTALLSTNGMWLAFLVAAIHAPLDELAWRGGFVATFRTLPRLGFWLGWALFVAWHVPLTLSVGMVFAGGALTLIGGAAALGLLWSWIAWRTGSVFYVGLAHFISSFVAFWVLFERNGFVGG